MRNAMEDFTQQVNDPVINNLGYGNHNQNQGLNKNSNNNYNYINDIVENEVKTICKFESFEQFQYLLPQDTI